MVIHGKERGLKSTGKEREKESETQRKRERDNAGHCYWKIMIGG